MTQYAETPFEFAEKWYGPDTIHRSITHNRVDVPKDVRSREFAEWLCTQYQLAMAKGIEIGRSGENF